MRVNLKELAVDMELRNRVIRLDVYPPKAKSGIRGKLYVNKTKLVWCKGKTSMENGKSITWNKFIEYMES